MNHAAFYKLITLNAREKVARFFRVPSIVNQGYRLRGENSVLIVTHPFGGMPAGTRPLTPERQVRNPARPPTASFYFSLFLGDFSEPRGSLSLRLGGEKIYFRPLFCGSARADSHLIL